MTFESMTPDECKIYVLKVLEKESKRSLPGDLEQWFASATTVNQSDLDVRLD